MENRKAPKTPAAPATIDLAILVRSHVLTVLNAKADEIAESGRFGDASYKDEDGRFHERGGFWNAKDPGRAVDGYGQGDITDVCGQLRALGVKVAAEDVDAYLAEMTRTGGLREATLVASIGGEPVTIALECNTASPEPTNPTEFRVRGMLVVEQRPDLFVVRPVVGADLIRTHVVLLKNSELACTCASANCGHVLAVQQHRAEREPISVLSDFRLSHPEHESVLRAVLPVFMQYGLFAKLEKRERGGQPRNAAQRALQLVLRALLGPGAREHVDAQRLQRLRIIDGVAGKSTCERDRLLPEVIEILHRVRAVATRPLRARGLEIPPLSREFQRGDVIAAEIVHSLRLDTRVTEIHAPNVFLEKTA